VAPLPAIARDSEHGALLTVHVQPGSSRTECVGIHGDAVKIRLAARPIDGAANDELIRFMPSDVGFRARMCSFMPERRGAVSG
jgi:uncharacterized protein (TIGR00251 family)